MWRDGLRHGKVCTSYVCRDRFLILSCCNAKVKSTECQFRALCELGLCGHHNLICMIEDVNTLVHEGDTLCFTSALQE